MSTDPIARFQALLDAGKDSPLLRFSLGMQHLRSGSFPEAAEHLRSAVTQDPGYSAAWKLLGKALDESGRTSEAVDAYREGIAAAEAKGDKQAMKEMTVFLRRLEKQKPGG